MKEREHDKAFYALCMHMEPSYTQLEFDLRLYLTHLDMNGERLFGKL
jgi:predicted metal-dependent hydrolase